MAYTLDNNIRLANLDYGTDIAVTTDGELNKVIYGVPDWGYEEEFGIDNTMRFSPDDQTLSFIRFDESKVPQYSFDLYSNFCEPMPEYEYYPGSFDYKYPLAGYNNSVVQVQTYNIDNRTVKTMDLGLGEKDYVPSLEYGGAPDRLMVMVLNRDQNHLRLYKVNPASTVAHQIYEDRSEAWLSPAAYQMVRYRNDAFVIGSERSGYRHLYEYNYAGTLLRTVTSGDYNVTALYGYEPKSRAYYLQCTKMVRRTATWLAPTAKVLRSSTPAQAPNRHASLKRWSILCALTATPQHPLSIRCAMPAANSLPNLR